MRVKIIKGYYGHHDGHTVKPIGIGGIVDVSNSEANRLISLGVASLLEEAEEEVEKPTPKATPKTRKKGK